jgi:hypothetical protein
MQPNNSQKTEAIVIVLVVLLLSPFILILSTQIKGYQQEQVDTHSLPKIDPSAPLPDVYSSITIDLNAGKIRNKLNTSSFNTFKPLCLHKDTHFARYFPKINSFDLWIDMVNTDVPGNCKSEKGESLSLDTTVDFYFNNYYFPFEYTGSDITFLPEVIPENCPSGRIDCYVGLRDVVYDTKIIIPSGFEIIQAEEIGDNGLRILKFDIYRSAFYKTLTISIIVLSLILSTWTIFIKDTGTFIQSILAILFGLIGVRQLIVPFQTNGPIALDFVFLGLYIVVALTVIIRSLILETLSKQESKPINATDALLVKMRAEHAKASPVRTYQPLYRRILAFFTFWRRIRPNRSRQNTATADQRGIFKRFIKRFSRNSKAKVSK